MNFIKKIAVLAVILSVSHNISNAMDGGLTFKTQEELNGFIGKRAVELFDKLNKCSRYPDQAKREHPTIPGNFWNKEYIDPANGIFGFYKNKNIKASDALNQIFSNELNILDCFTARAIVTVKCIQEILGPTTFNNLYEIYEELNNNKGVIFLHTLYGLFMPPASNEITIKNYFKAGGLVSVRNLAGFAAVNPNGVYENDNLITVCNGNEQCKYIGFGKEYLNGPLSYDEVREYMLKDYFAGVIKKHLNLNYLDIDSIKNYTHIDDEERCIFDLIQGVPVTTITLYWINRVKKAKNKKEIVDFLKG